MKFVKIAAWLIVAILSALSFATLLSSTHYEIAGIKFEVSLFPHAQGGTELLLPPIGAVKARTHKIPVRLRAEVEGINQNRLEEALGRSRTAKDYFDQVNRDARRQILGFFLKLIAIAGLGGLIGSLFFTRTWWQLIAGSLAGIAAMALLTLGLYMQFDGLAFAQPEFSGPLSSARWVAASIEKRSNPIDTLREDIRLAVGNLSKFANKVEAWQPVFPEKGTITVLAVSDIHNSPAGFTLVRRVAHDFSVDFVVDTGDITDFGTPIEAGLLSQLASFNRPYLYIPGNHDSPAVVDTMRSLPQVKILDDNMEEIKGIKVYGLADPMSTSTKVKPASNKQMKKLARQVARRVGSVSDKPLIVALHDPRMSAEVVSKVPIIQVGHTHKASIEEKGKTAIINPGTTGASGIRALNNNHTQELSFTVSLLYIDAREKKLIAVDSIQVTGLEGEFILKRKLVKARQKPIRQGQAVPSGTAPAGLLP